MARRQHGHKSRPRALRRRVNASVGGQPERPTPAPRRCGRPHRRVGSRHSPLRRGGGADGARIGDSRGRWQQLEAHLGPHRPECAADAAGFSPGPVGPAGPSQGVAQLAATIGRDFRFDLLAELSGLEPRPFVPCSIGCWTATCCWRSTRGARRATPFGTSSSKRWPTSRCSGGPAAPCTSASLICSRTASRRGGRSCRRSSGTTTRRRVCSATRRSATGWRRARPPRAPAIEKQSPSSVTPCRWWSTSPRDAARDEVEVEMLLALGSAIMATKSYAEPEIEATYDRARELCERLGNDSRVGLALAGLSIYYINRGETLLGATMAERVLAIALARGDDTLELLGRVQLALARNNLGESKASLDHSLRAIEIYDPDRHRGIAQRFGTDQGVAAHIFAGWGCLIQGYLDEGLTHMNDGVALAEALDQPFQLVYRPDLPGDRPLGTGGVGGNPRGCGAGPSAGPGAGLRMVGFGERSVGSGRTPGRTGDASELPELLDIAARAAASGNRGGSTNVIARVAEGARAAGDAPPPPSSSTWRSKPRSRPTSRGGTPLSTACGPRSCSTGPRPPPTPRPKTRKPCCDRRRASGGAPWHWRTSGVTRCTASAPPSATPSISDSGVAPARRHRCSASGCFVVRRARPPR